VFHRWKLISAFLMALFVVVVAKKDHEINFL